MVQNASASMLPVFGWPGESFYIIHSVAICSCGVSILASASVIIFLFLREQRTTRRGFYTWTTGERLVVYLAMFDLGFSTSHTMDHAYIFAAVDHPPDLLCRFFAFLVAQNIISQGLVVLFTAVSAMLLVMFQKKIPLGRYDWRLFLYAVGLPFAFCTFGIVFKYLGASGAWCLMEARNHLGKVMNNVLSALLFMVFFGCGLSYLLIWGQMRRTGPELTGTAADIERIKRYHRSAKIMLLFVVAYVLQWWPWVGYAMWAYFGVPSIWFIVVTVFLCNMGGVFNGFAYTVMRKKYLESSKAGRSVESASRSTQSHPTSTTPTALQCEDMDIPMTSARPFHFPSKTGIYYVQKTDRQ